MQSTRLRTLLVGDDEEARRRGVLGTVGLSVSGVALLAALWLLSALDVVLPPDLAWMVASVAVASVGSAALFAYRHEGLLLCLALGSALPVALFLVPAASPTMAPDESLVWGLQSGLLFGIPAGALGFLLGLGARTLGGASRATS